MYRAILNPFTGQMQLINDASSLSFKDAVATYADLPLTGNTKNDARITSDTSHVYIWSKDVSSGLLADWIDQGIVFNLTWTSISGRPSSSPADIDDAVNKRITLIDDTALQCFTLTKP